jgi:ribosome maturation factor RimP
MHGVPESVRAIASRVAGSHGLEIFDVQFRREDRGMVLRVQIDRPWPTAAKSTAKNPSAAVGDSVEGVTVEDCARVSRDLSAVLDVDDVVPTAYILEVSSPGLDRPLRSAADYDRFSGRRAKVVMREAVDGQMFFKGRLEGLDSNGGDGGSAAIVIVTDDDKRHRVPLGVITRANLEVEF